MGLRGPKPLTFEQFRDHFWERVDSSAGPDACHPWTGGYGGNGYGVVRASGVLKNPTGTHRVAFWLANGRWPEPEGRHTCDNYGCCNPRHIIEGTHAQNMKDAIDRNRFRIGGITSGTWSKGDTLQIRQQAKTTANQEEQ